MDEAQDLLSTSWACVLVDPPFTLANRGLIMPHPDRTVFAYVNRRAVTRPVPPAGRVRFACGS